MEQWNANDWVPIAKDDYESIKETRRCHRDDGKNEGDWQRRNEGRHNLFMKGIIDMLSTKSYAPCDDLTKRLTLSDDTFR